MNPESINPGQLDKIKQANTVKSANATSMAWLKIKDITKLVFCKNTKPAVARLETVVAEFFRHTLGKDRTAHGKVIVENGKVVGSYVEAIPGFVSMKDIMELAKQPGELDKKIEDLGQDIIAIIGKITDGDKDTNLATKLRNKQNNLFAYQAIKKLGLIDEKNKEVDLSKISGLLPKALCTAFFYEDWDRHKENFGLSFADGKLGIASLDYDKSLNGSFPTLLQNYDWKITAQRLRDFPIFKCWFWPTGSTSISASIKNPEKMPKMYTQGEIKQYSAFKDNYAFKRQAMTEWLKLAFIPKELRQDAVTNLAGPNCNPKLKAVPDRLESKRKDMIDSLVRLNYFRFEFNSNRNKDKDSILANAREDLITSLDKNELPMVNKEWDKIQKDIENKVEAINKLETKAKELGHHQLVVAIRKSGISFPSNLKEGKLESTLDKISTLRSPKEIAKQLNKELDLNISEADARKIKQENYLNMICKDMPEDLRKTLMKKFDEGGIEIKKGSFPRDKTLETIKSFEETVQSFKDFEGDEFNTKFEEAIKSLRSLGIKNDVISDEDLRKSWRDTIENEKKISPGF